MNELKDQIKTSIDAAIKISGSQVLLAKKAGLTQGAISKYRLKKSIPSGVAAKKLSKAVDGLLTPEDFAPHIFGD